MLCLTIIGFDSLKEIIRAIFISEFSNDGNGLRCLYLSRHFGDFAHDLPRTHILDRILYYRTFRFTVVARRLRKVLETEANSQFVAACCGDQVVEAVDIDRRQLVDDDRVLELFLVNQLHYT